MLPNSIPSTVGNVVLPPPGTSGFEESGTSEESGFEESSTELSSAELFESTSEDVSETDELSDFFGAAVLTPITQGLAAQYVIFNENMKDYYNEATVCATGKFRQLRQVMHNLEKIKAL